MPRPIYTDPEIAGVGLTEAQAREQYGDDVAVGVFPWVANARAVMQDETVGWVKSIHETQYGELLGLVMVGPHVTDLIEAGVGRDRRRGDGRDGRRRHDARTRRSRGDQGSGPRRTRPRDPSARNKKRAPAQNVEISVQGFRECGISNRRTSASVPHQRPCRPPAPPFSQSRPLAAEGAAHFYGAHS